MIRCDFEDATAWLSGIYLYEDLYDNLYDDLYDDTYMMIYMMTRCHEDMDIR